MSNTRTAVYLRISSDPTGQQLGVARQREDCLALCRRKGWQPVEYVDNDISASSGKRRPAYDRMLTDIADGKIGAVVTWHLDRLHRQPIELEQFMALADDHKVKLATVTGDVDLSTDDGQFMARIMGAVARKEVDRKRARQLRAAQQKAEQGRPQWKRAFGYRGDTYLPDPVTAPLVAEAYRAVLAGASLNDICRLLNDAGAFGLKGQKWTPTTVSIFLRKPRNAGLRAHNGEIVGKGTWPALVDEPLWRAVQAKLNGPGRGPGKKSVRQHLLTGVLQCGREGCGGYLAGKWVMRPTGGKSGRPKAGEVKEPHPGQVAHSISYGCKVCHGSTVRAQHVEPLVFDLIAGRLAQGDAVDLLKSELHDSAEAEAIRTERATLLARLDDIADERADGLLTGHQAKRATDRITGKLAELDSREQDQERMRVFDGLPLGRPEVADALADLSPDRLRAVIAVLCTFTVVPVGKGGNVFNPDRLQVTWL